MSERPQLPLMIEMFAPLEERTLASGMSRRGLLRGLPLLLVSNLTRAEDVPHASDRLQAVEARVGGRLGVAALDTGNGRRIHYHANERWPLCSTFKVLLVGAVLATVDSGRERLDRAIRYSRNDLLGYAPISRANLARGQMTVSELCRAAVCYSDNTAANLLFPVVGGPAGLTRYLRSLGDRTTNLNRTEPSLNESLPGDIRDTTSPSAMVYDMERLLLHKALSMESQALLTKWLVGCTTGYARLRAGLPQAWRIGDKTGTGKRGTSNDVAIAWPQGRKPILIAAYLTGSTAPASGRDAALAEVGRIVKDEMANPSPSANFDRWLPWARV